MKSYFVYILASMRNGTLYIGVTNNLERRIVEHKLDLNEGFTKKYCVHRLVWFEEYGDIHEAIAREKRLKRWRRAWKIALIEEQNPDWMDLFIRMVGPQAAAELSRTILNK
jgi:putative endonuclease